MFLGKLGTQTHSQSGGVFHKTSEEFPQDVSLLIKKKKQDFILKEQASCDDHVCDDFFCAQL